MYFLSFLVSLLIAQFIIAIYLFNNSYCGTLAKCNLILNLLPPPPIPNICLPLNKCNSTINIVNSNCSLSPDDDTMTNNVYLGYVFAILLFVSSIVTLIIYYIASEKYLYNFMNIIVIILTIIVFAFNMVTYDNCMNANCNLKILTDVTSINSEITTANMRCTESNFKKSNIYNFYIAICLLVSITIIAVPIYIYYNTMKKSYSRFL